MDKIDLAKAVNDYHESGYCLVPQAISETDRAAFQSRASAAYDAEPWLNIGSPVAKDENIQDLMKRRFARLDELLPDRRALMLTDKVYDVLSAIMSDEPILHSQNIPFKYSLSHAAHPAPDHDFKRNGHVHHYAHIEPAKACVIGWLALEDISADAGPMWICPGSHRDNAQLFDHILAAHPDLDADLLKLRQTGAPYKVWSDWFMRMQKIMTNVIEDRIDHRKRERMPVLFNGGDLLLFDPALSHGTLESTNLSATRWSMVGKYQGRHSVERAWATRLGASIYEPALKNVPPAKVSIKKLSHGKGSYAVDAADAHYRMFWSEPLPQTMLNSQNE